MDTPYKPTDHAVDREWAQVSYLPEIPAANWTPQTNQGAVLRAVKDNQKIYAEQTDQGRAEDNGSANGAKTDYTRANRILIGVIVALWLV